MELLRFAVLALLLCLALAGNDATSSRSAEECWRSIWPDATLPKNLEYLLGSGVNDADNKDTQYPYTSFFEDDLHAGKQMNIIFNTLYSDEEQKSNAMEKDAEKSTSSQPWGVESRKSKNTMNEDLEKSSSTQPYGVFPWKRNAIDGEKSATTQPYGVFAWKRNKMDGEMSSTTQPYGVFAWKKNALDAEKPATTQPYGVFTWKRNPMDGEKSATTQPYGVFAWKRNAMDAEKLATNQPYGVFTWKRNAMDAEKLAANQPYGVFTWKRNAMVNQPENLSLEAICNTKERFVGEDDKFCAKSVESLLDFVISKLGKDIEALTSSFVPHQTQYTILEGVQRISSEGVMCHKLNFDKPVFYCHQVNATITYIVPMEAADGTRTSVVALCHRDTRGMDPHKLFNQLKVMPGTVPVCHFLGSGAISWVPRNNELKVAY